jgi:molybdate transport system ATP-binding protein
MKMQLECTNVFVQVGGKPVIKHINLHVNTVENLAITGESGSGKSSLAKAISQKIFFRGEISFLSEHGQKLSPRVILIEQQHAFKNNSNVSNFYYQQRFNSCDADDALRVEDELKKMQSSSNNEWINLLGLKTLLHKPMIQLSNGENKRLQFAKALIQEPELLILDSPFIGLDIAGRELLKDVILQLIDRGTKIILIAPLDEIPDYFDKTVVLRNGKIDRIYRKGEIELPRQRLNREEDKLSEDQINRIKDIYTQQTFPFNEVVCMKDVNISYNGRSILSNINLTIKKGERWAVAGPNGAGKSTLLSLITADNPQAYANDIWLFERKRGSGESIWEIKKNIGYVSPELHLYFDKSISVIDTVASGLFDTIGLFRKPTNCQIEKINNWLKVIGIEELRTSMLNQLSLGQQRLVMLARALVKAPPLLILDEPCQGLDTKQTNGFKSLIEAICLVSDTTLIYVSHYTNDIPQSIQKRLNLMKGHALQDIS